MSVMGFKKDGTNKKNTSGMIKGYKEMARINTELSKEGLCSDNEALDNYELILAESEKCDFKKGRHILR